MTPPDRLANFEAPFIVRLRDICEEIGYGRVIQLAGQWMDEKYPGWLRAHDKVAVERVTKDWHCAVCKQPMQFKDGMCWKCFGGDPGR